MKNAAEFRRRWSGHTPGLLGARQRYAVLCPLLERPDGLHFLFEVRSAALKQAGEVCFPGGRAEPGEALLDCALRETFEELAIPPERVEILGQSDFLCQPGKFLLQPVIGLVDRAGFSAMRPSSDEVAEVFTVPVSFFADTPPQSWTYALEPQVPSDFPYEAVGIPADYRWGRGRVEVPVWTYDGHVIWGMTARILKNIMGAMTAGTPPMPPPLSGR